MKRFEQRIYTRNMLFSDYNRETKLFKRIMNTRCIFCITLCVGYSCSRCNQMDRGLKFSRLLQLLGKSSESIMYRDEINAVVQRIQQVSLLE